MLLAQCNPPVYVVSVQGAIHVQSSVLAIAGDSTFLFNLAGIDGGETVEAL